jgi:hypothetical protein
MGVLIGMGAPRSPPRRWTSGEENRLREMLEAGNTVIDIAAELLSPKIDRPPCQP